LKIIITEEGKFELDRLKFDIKSSIDNIMKYIPDKDVVGVSHIIISEVPPKKKNIGNKARASYTQKHKMHPARIEIYLKNLFAHIKNAESFGMMLPIQESWLAQVIYHEIGHHVRLTRTHRIKKKESEKFADSYSDNIYSMYILDNAEAISSCFNYLESVAEEKGLNLDTVNNMRAGWMRSYEEVIEKSRQR
jgi:hypothetical protein